MNNWFLSSSNSHCLDNLNACFIWQAKKTLSEALSLVLLNSLNVMSLSFFACLCSLSIRIYNSPFFALSLPLMLFFLPCLFFIFFICAIWPSITVIFLHLSVSLFHIYRMPGTVKTLRLAFPYCLTDVGSSGKEPSRVGPHLTLVFRQTAQYFSFYERAFLRGKDLYGKLSHHPLKKCCICCVHRRVKQYCARFICACFGIFYKRILYDRRAHLFHM